MNERRKLAAAVANGLRPSVGMVIVVVANESAERDGALEIDFSARTGEARTASGSNRLAELARELGRAIEQVTRELADAWRCGFETDINAGGDT